MKLLPLTVCAHDLVKQIVKRCSSRKLVIVGPLVMKDGGYCRVLAFASRDAPVSTMLDLVGARMFR